MIAGYRIPGSSRGMAFEVPDDCWGRIKEGEADEIAQALREASGREPHWQTVRSILIRDARAKGAAQ
jgi:hypothetical protein